MRTAGRNYARKRAREVADQLFHDKIDVSAAARAIDALAAEFMITDGYLDGCFARRLGELARTGRR